MFFTYVLYSLKDGNLYIGFTPDDPYRRFAKHEAGLVQSTKSRLPMKLIFFEAFLCQDDALRRERYFKTTDGHRALKLMLRETMRTL